MDKKTLERILKYLESLYKPTFFERSDDPFYVLIFTVLSQRTKDVNTEKVTQGLFRYYGTPSLLANAPIDHVEKLIRASGFYHVKAERIKRISQDLIDRFEGQVPKTREELLSLEGVGPKTANCTLVYGFRIPAIPVDTHVHRISNRLGIVRTRSPEETESALASVLPKSRWIQINELMVRFGQQQCLPRHPRCEICRLTDICLYYNDHLNLERNGQEQ